MQLGKLGVWAAMDVLSAAEGAAFAQRVERWGYAALWLPESRGRNVLVHSSWLLANTKRLIVAPGIANIYARDAMAMANGQRALAEQSGGRFLLGIGVSHVPSVEGVRGHPYGKPVATMRGYLEAMRAAPYGAPEPAERPLTILAALGPRMLALSGSHADGAHPYNVTPEHTAEARRILGPGTLLCPEVWVLLEEDPAKARALSRQALANYMRLDNYVNNWRRLRPLCRCQCRLGRRGGDPKAHRGALAGGRRPCLHPVDQPRRLAPAGREGAGAARPRVGRLGGRLDA